MARRDFYGLRAQLGLKKFPPETFGRSGLSRRERRPTARSCISTAGDSCSVPSPPTGRWLRGWHRPPGRAPYRWIIAWRRSIPSPPRPTTASRRTASWCDPGSPRSASSSPGIPLALVLLLALRPAGDPLPAAAVCLSPATDLAWTGESFQTKVKIDPVFPQGSSSPLSARIESGYIGSEAPRNPLISPLYGDWHGMPPILLQVGEDEILLDDSRRLADRVRAAGGQATIVVWPHMWHVFQVFAPFLPEANQSIQQIGEFIKEMQRQ
jgi:hypothetical protein